MQIEIDKYYKTRDGRKAFVGYWREGFRYEFVGHIFESDKMSGDWYLDTNLGRWQGDGMFYTAALEMLGGAANDLVSEWEDVEEIDVSAMWVAIYRDCSGGLWGKTPHKEKKDTFKTYKKRIIVAQVTVSDWQDIQSGKRKLVVGEGCE